MSIILQPTLFDIDYLEQLAIEQKYTEIFTPIQWDKILSLFDKKTSVGAPITTNYEAVLRSLMARFYEKIPEQQLLIQRLKEDVRFKLSLGFLYSEPIPSASTYSRVMGKLAENMDVLLELNQDLFQLINEAFQIFEENVSIDATAVTAGSKPQKTENPKLPSTEVQRNMTTDEILALVPTYPSWGVKKNSKGKNEYWFGYKATLAVSSTSQYILDLQVNAAFVADLSVAIPVVRKVKQLTGETSTKRHIQLDKGYDAQAIYKEAHELGFEPIIPLKRVPKNVGEVDTHFSPTCLLEYSYHYDSYDTRYGALKFTRPEKNCKTCPLQREGLCQKVIKVKQMHDPRKYNHPARGSLSWKRLYNQRSSVERANTYLKSGYSLNHVKRYKSAYAQVEYALIQLAYNAKTFANQRLARENGTKEIVA